MAKNGIGEGNINVVRLMMMMMAYQEPEEDERDTNTKDGIAESEVEGKGIGGQWNVGRRECPLIAPFPRHLLQQHCSSPRRLRPKVKRKLSTGFR